jgi:chemotaxis protein CheD
MAMLVIGVGACTVSADPTATLITYALGSCIAVLIYDPVTRVGGLLHYMLPESSLDEAKAKKNPYMFADTGVPLLFQNAYKLGAVRNRLQVNVLGGAQIISASDSFNIGKRNHMILRKIFWKAGILVQHEEVGGTQSRTVRLELDTGRVVMRSGQMETVLPAGKQKG